MFFLHFANFSFSLDITACLYLLMSEFDAFMAQYVWSCMCTTCMRSSSQIAKPPIFGLCVNGARKSPSVRWRIKLNGSKSKLVVLHRKKMRLPDDLALQLGNDIIYPSHSAKFLGLEIDNKMSFNADFDEKARKSMARLNLLRMLSRKGVENTTLIKLYKTFVRPLFEYGCVATISTNQSNIQKIQRVQNEFIRVCLKLPKYISTKILHEASGLEMVIKRLEFVAKKHFEKLKKDDNVKSLIENRQSLNALYDCRSPLDVLM